MDIFSKNYKFYLGFENSFCDGYITEKFYKYFNLDLIVVTRGINQYSNIVPSEAYINALDYDSPKKLAEKLLYLDTHDDAYVNMLKEKDKYFTIYEDYRLSISEYRGVYDLDNYIEHRYEAVPFCQVCQRLWNLEKYSKTIPDISAWHRQSQCYLPTDMNNTHSTTKSDAG